VKRGSPERARQSREGSTAILVMFAMVVIIGVMAHSIDMGHLYKVRTELQGGADATALVGAAELDGSPAGVTNAGTEIGTFSATKNTAYASYFPIASADISYGTWADDAKTFTAVDVSGNYDALTVNAVSITARRDSNTNWNVGTPFGDFINPGEAGGPVSASAIAWADVPDACAFPLTIADCQVAEVDEGTCESCFVASSAVDDTYGFSSLSNDVSATEAIAAALILKSCFVDGDATQPSINEATKMCTGGCNGSSLEDVVNGGNGNNLLSDAPGQDDEPCDYLKTLLQRPGGDDDPDGSGDGAAYFSVTIPTFEADCSGSIGYQGDLTLNGYVVLDIWGINCDAGAGAVPIIDDDHPMYAEFAADPAFCDGAADRMLLVSLNCEEEPQDPGDVSSDWPIRLVQ